ncbi:MAG: hypothetical protein MUP14_04425 [Dehalococcoidia bacterium]|nr:hypothetical protein [Dehalococcoidia bacterium]
MIRFYAGLVTTVMRDLAMEVSALGFWVADIEHHGGERTIASLSYDVKVGMVKALDQLVVNPDEMPLSQRIRFKIGRLKNRIENADDPITVSQAMVLFQELHNDITAELATPYFLMIPEDRRRFYEQAYPIFSPHVAEVFPDASYDIAAAGRLIALDRAGRMDGGCFSPHESRRAGSSRSGTQASRQEDRNQGVGHPAR